MKAISDKRRLILAAQGITHPVSTLQSRRKPAAPKQRVDTGPDIETAHQVAERESYGCTVCGHFLSGPRGQKWSVHHRILRSQGVDNRLFNLIAVCGGATKPGCHQEIHSSPAKAREGGWLLKSTDNPATFPVAHYLHGWVLLGADGSVEQVPR